MEQKFFETQDYKDKLKQEADFWSKENKQNEKNFLKKIFSFFGLYGKVDGVDYRNEIIFKPHKIIWGRKQLETLFKIASKGKRILEIGAGNGWLSIEIARRNKNVEIDAMDITKGAMEKGKTYYSCLNKKEKIGKVNFIIQDLNKISLKKEKYDVVFAFAALHHILNLNGLLIEIKKSLKPEGFLIAYEDNDLCESDKKKLAIIFYPFLFLKNLLKGKNISFNNIKKEVEYMYEWSTIRKTPFEGVHKGAFIDNEIEKNFDIKIKETTRCFIDGVIRTANLPIMRICAGPLKILDNLVLKLGILSEGRSIFIVGKKK